MNRSAWLVLLALGGGACGGPPESSSQVRARFTEFEDAALFDVGSVRADLEILLDDGSPAVANVQVQNPGDQPPSVNVESPVPMRCSGFSCELSFSLPPGSYRFTLLLYAADRCGRESLIGAFRPLDEGSIQLLPLQPFLLDLSRTRFDFDDDGDGIENILEIQTCGRSDYDERDATPTSCAPATHPCCSSTLGDPNAWGSDLIGRTTQFAGGTYEGPSGQGQVTVGAFDLDATEVTWGQLARCVAAGRCLAGAPAHAVRVALPVQPRAYPATGLSPREASLYCQWAGKRLPTDEEWDFAAAAREDTTDRAPFPFDASELPHLLEQRGDDVAPGPLPDDAGDLQLSCFEGEATLAANHASSLSEACALAPLEVGSYPSSHAYRGEGPPIADLAGNVWEWTLPASALADPEGDPNKVFPGELTSAFIRGGNFRSAPLVLSNAFNRIVVDEDDVERLTRESGQIADAVGFRCARAPNAAPPLREPTCSEVP